MGIRSCNKWLNVMRAVGVVLVILSSQIAALAATIKTKDGRIVEGKIRGMIVQKGEVKLEKSAEGTIHLVHYDMSNGEDIVTIDEEGVHRSHIWGVTVSAIGGLPTDLEVFKPGEKTTGLGAPRVSAKGLKYNVFAIDFRPRVPSKAKLLGEFRTVNGKDVVIPALHVTTTEGAVDIPVADIVPFDTSAKEKRSHRAGETIKVAPDVTLRVVTASLDAFRDVNLAGVGQVFELDFDKGAGRSVALEPWTDPANSGIVLLAGATRLAPKALGLRLSNKPDRHVIPVDKLERNRVNGRGTWFGFSARPNVQFLFDVPRELANHPATLSLEILLDGKPQPIGIEIIK